MKNCKLIILVLFLLLSSTLYAKSGKILNGKILEINKKHDFVIISIGKEDGVKKGMAFLVYREKKLIGKVEAEEVFKDMSSCIILPWYQKEEFKIDDGVLKP